MRKEILSHVKMVNGIVEIVLFKQCTIRSVRRLRLLPLLLELLSALFNVGDEKTIENSPSLSPQREFYYHPHGTPSTYRFYVSYSILLFVASHVIYRIRQ
ncbi:hypothetical protein K505DRAFT_109250 [Melanomma pulvis-pyrius CBS 109.77]|uniref:Uncharacterized protein n=1 Tax=Melanomma pulvis-pyrius CBS 109.77 TaxID=1314802 RepID=A0A6A6XPU6_9PLEO|nr:hypothetical protein K505DRAFT_109250 [Melanomma pulvis-pyrius CBS 109.77]